MNSCSSTSDVRTPYINIYIYANIHRLVGTNLLKSRNNMSIYQQSYYATRFLLHQDSQASMGK
jgi:hypothetical protein